MDITTNSQNDMYNKIQSFIVNQLHNKKLYNHDLNIGDEYIVFSIGNEVFKSDVDISIETLYEKIEYFIIINNF